MKKQLILIAYALAILCSAQAASASSLDELYRDIIRSDNKGYLPLFVKNRQVPDVLNEEKIAAEQKAPAAEPIKSSVESVSLVNPIPAKEAIIKAKQLKWEHTMQAVQQNRVTPLDLDEIKYRIKLNDPKAVEMMAWMYTKGVGVQVDYIEAYHLYQKAAGLDIPQANRNASIIFKAMNDEQRQRIKNF